MRQTSSHRAGFVAIAVGVWTAACSSILGIHDIPDDGGQEAAVDGGVGAEAAPEEGSAEAVADTPGSADTSEATLPGDAPSEPQPPLCTPGAVKSCTDATHGIVCDGTGQWSGGPVACPQPTPDCSTAGATPQCTCLGHIGGGACVEPTPVAAATNQPYHVEVDATYLYWSEFPANTGCDVACSDGTIKRVPLVGGPTTTLVSGLPTAADFRINASGVYWAGTYCPPDGGACVDGLLGVPLGGGMPGVTAAIKLKEFTLDRDNAYGITPGSIVKIPLNGAPSTTLATGVAASSIAVDPSYACWTDGAQGAVMRVGLGGGVSTTVASSLFRPAELADDGAYLYWVEPTCNDASTCSTLSHAPIVAGGAAKLATSPDVVAWLVPYLSSLYFSSFAQVSAIPVNGGPVTLLATPAAGIAQDIAVTATQVYWADQNGTNIEAIAHP